MKKKTILIAGAGGMIGQALTEYLKGNDILKAARSDFQKNDLEFIRDYESADVIMNFAGAPILQRWTTGNRKKILDSRINTTRKLGLIIEKGLQKNRQFISASAIGIYSDSGIHDESSQQAGKGFMRDVIEAWEKAAMALENSINQVVVLRLGVVLSPNGGIIKKLLPIFKIGLGGRISNGKQAFSWIHIEDLAGAVRFIIDNNKAGVYNITAPETCRNIDFTMQLAKAVNKPFPMVLPSFALKLFYGKGAAVICGGQAVIPARMQKEGFVFKFPNLSAALEDIVN